MERGGSLLHFSSPRIPTSAAVSFLLSRARFSLRCGERSFPCCRESFLSMYKELHKSQYAVKVLSSCQPQEVDMDGKEVASNKFLIDCETDQQCVVGGIVALGKFDALHLGHRELAIQASKFGIPFLLSFVGIAEVLGWESRPPIVAQCDRQRVLSSWAPHCGNIVPLEYQIDFSKVRHLSPPQFVERLSKELRVAGVVAGISLLLLVPPPSTFHHLETHFAVIAGENYRFGYKASGDATDLVRLCGEYGLHAHIVSSVMDGAGRGSRNGAGIAADSDDRGQVSSTRVRNALAARDMAYVAELLGRKHRLVLAPAPAPANQDCGLVRRAIIAPKSRLLNQPPGDGEFGGCALMLDDVSVGLCRVVIDSDSISIELERESSPAIDLVRGGACIGIEF